MKTLPFLLITIALLAFTSCQHYAPNAKTGAVGGGFAGAGVGAIIGNQSDRPLEGAGIGAVIGALGGWLLGSAQDDYEYQQSPPPAAGTPAPAQAPVAHEDYADASPPIQQPRSRGNTTISIGGGYGHGGFRGGRGFGGVGVSHTFPGLFRRPYGHHY